MVKNYNENAFNELVNTINKHIDGDSSALPVLVDMITEVDKKYPMLKNKFIHDMGSFMTHWFNLINDSKSCSLKLRAKILTVDFVTTYSDFNNFTTYCYDVIDQEINPHTNRLYSSDLLSYLACIIKAIIQTTRRQLDLDLNSKKYGNTIKNDTATA